MEIIDIENRLANDPAFRTWASQLLLKFVNAPVSDEADGLHKVINDYTYALDILDQYDHRTLTTDGVHQTASFIATYDTAMNAIKGLPLNRRAGARTHPKQKRQQDFRIVAVFFRTRKGADVELLYTGF